MSEAHGTPANVFLSQRGCLEKKILIADDEPNIVVSLEFLMRHAGYSVRSARDGDEALRQLVEFKPDLILLDIMLPVHDGFEICQRIRADADLKNVKVVMLSAKGRDVEVAKGLALGADQYITKPFATRDLLASVQQLIGG